MAHSGQFRLWWKASNRKLFRRQPQLCMRFHHMNACEPANQLCRFKFSMHTGRSQTQTHQMPQRVKSNWNMSRQLRLLTLTLSPASSGNRRRLRSNQLICWPHQETTFAYGHCRIRSPYKAQTRSPVPRTSETLLALSFPRWLCCLTQNLPSTLLRSLLLTGILSLQV